jgi:hypothetical protein
MEETMAGLQYQCPEHKKPVPEAQAEELEFRCVAPGCGQTLQRALQSSDAHNAAAYERQLIWGTARETVEKHRLGEYDL